MFSFNMWMFIAKIYTWKFICHTNKTMKIETVLICQNTGTLCGHRGLSPLITQPKSIQQARKGEVKLHLHTSP